MSSQIPNSWVIRTNEPDDFKFIINSWLKSYRNSAPCVHISNIPYYSFHGELIERYVKKYETSVLYDQENDNIIGYIVYKKEASAFWLAYVYVKYPYRKSGLMKYMFDRVGLNTYSRLFITHLFKDFNRFKQSYPQCEYIPYMEV